MYEPKNFEKLLGLEGFSDVLLRNHFALYEGYVSNTNKLLEILKTIEIGTSEWSEVKRRLGWEWNGMRLHELYFGNMTKESFFDKKSKLAKKINEDFGSFELWQKDFQGTGAIRGIGWVILAHDVETGRLFNVWVNEHDTGHLVGTRPILVMDVFEHAFMIDYGIKRAGYIKVFWNVIDWKGCDSRFQI